MAKTNMVLNWIRNHIREIGYFRIEELAIGGHCGLCGKWIPDEIFPAYWRWGICKDHLNESE